VLTLFRYAALISTTLANQALVMLEPPKKHALTCDTLLAEFTAQSLTLRSPSASPVTSRALTFSARAHNGFANGGGGGGLAASPEAPDYFRLGAGMSQQRRQTSRWKEDWEELELLVRHCVGVLFVLSVELWFCRAKARLGRW
jgi:translation initiation factor 2-alpha kinase 4